LNACAICGVDSATEHERGYFSPAHGGFVCRKCEASTPDRLEIDPRLLRILRSLVASRDRLPRLTRHQTDPINAMFATHVEHTLGRRLRMPRWILAPARPTGDRRPAVTSTP
jgi:recombinational DNA repair protein (RecF pathway)